MGSFSLTLSVQSVMAITTITKGTIKNVPYFTMIPFMLMAVLFGFVQV